MPSLPSSFSDLRAASWASTGQHQAVYQDRSPRSRPPSCHQADPNGASSLHPGPAGGALHLQARRLRSTDLPRRRRLTWLSRTAGGSPHRLRKPVRGGWVAAARPGAEGGRRSSAWLARARSGGGMVNVQLGAVVVLRHGEGRTNASGLFGRWVVWTII